MRRYLICGVLMISSLGLEGLPQAQAQSSAPVPLNNGVYYKDQGAPLVAAAYSRRRYRARRRSRPTYYVHRRSKKKSAAIIGGSAAGGAAIGALAGGGKGAAIGAIAGGGAGYIYDRKTHKKVYRNY